MAWYKQPFIIVPLYIYPTPTAWEPLFSAAAAHPEVTFVVIVNPADGPGTTQLPDTNYLAALARISSLDNIRTLGYVHCSYGNRATAEVERDIRAYQGWNVESRRGGEAKVR